jgi:hypothetical protein
MPLQANHNIFGYLSDLRVRISERCSQHHGLVLTNFMKLDQRSNCSSANNSVCMAQCVSQASYKTLTGNKIPHVAGAIENADPVLQAFLSNQNSWNSSRYISATTTRNFQCFQHPWTRSLFAMLLQIAAKRWHSCSALFAQIQKAIEGLVGSSFLPPHQSTRQMIRASGWNVFCEIELPHWGFVLNPSNQKRQAICANCANGSRHFRITNYPASPWSAARFNRHRNPLTQLLPLILRLLRPVQGGNQHHRAHQSADSTNHQNLLPLHTSMMPIHMQIKTIFAPFVSVDARSGMILPEMILPLIPGPSAVSPLCAFASLRLRRGRSVETDRSFSTR